jgi:hypothetical protein
MKNKDTPSAAAGPSTNMMAAQQSSSGTPVAAQTPQSQAAPGKIVKKQNSNFPASTKPQKEKAVDSDSNLSREAEPAVDNSLLYAVPPKKQPIHPEQPLVNQSLSYSLDMYVNQQAYQTRKGPEIGESNIKQAAPPILEQINDESEFPTPDRG